MNYNKQGRNPCSRHEVARGGGGQDQMKKKMEIKKRLQEF